MKPATQRQAASPAATREVTRRVQPSPDVPPPDPLLTRQIDRSHSSSGVASKTTGTPVAISSPVKSMSGGLNRPPLPLAPLPRQHNAKCTGKTSVLDALLEVALQSDSPMMEACSLSSHTAPHVADPFPAVLTTTTPRSEARPVPPYSADTQSSSTATPRLALPADTSGSPCVSKAGSTTPHSYPLDHGMAMHTSPLSSGVLSVDVCQPEWKRHFAASAQHLLRETQSQVSDLLHYRTNYEAAVKRIAALQQELQEAHEKLARHRAMAQQEQTDQEAALQLLSKEALDSSRTVREVREEKANLAGSLEVLRTENEALRRRLKDALHALKDVRQSSSAQEAHNEGWLAHYRLQIAADVGVVKQEAAHWKQHYEAAAAREREQAKNILRLEKELVEALRDRQGGGSVIEGLKELPINSQTPDTKDLATHIDEEGPLQCSLLTEAQTLAQQEHLLCLRAEVRRLDRELNDRAIQHEKSLSEAIGERAAQAAIVHQMHEAVRGLEAQVHGLQEDLRTAEADNFEKSSVIHLLQTQLKTQEPAKVPSHCQRAPTQLDECSLFADEELAMLLNEVLPRTAGNDLLSRFRMLMEGMRENGQGGGVVAAREDVTGASVALCVVVRDIIVHMASALQRRSHMDLFEQHLPKEAGSMAREQEVASLRNSLHRVSVESETLKASLTSCEKNNAELLQRLQRHHQLIRGALREYFSADKLRRDAPANGCGAHEISTSPDSTVDLLTSMTEGLLQLFAIFRETKHQLQMTRSSKKADVIRLEEALKAERAKTQALETEATQSARAFRAREQKQKAVAAKSTASLEERISSLQRALDIANSSLDHKSKEHSAAAKKLRVAEAKFTEMQNINICKVKQLKLLSEEHIEYTQALRDAVAEQSVLKDHLRESEDQAHAATIKAESYATAAQCLYVTLAQMCRWVAWLLLRHDAALQSMRWYKYLGRSDRMELAMIQDVLRSFSIPSPLAKSDSLLRSPRVRLLFRASVRAIQVLVRLSKRVRQRKELLEAEVNSRDPVPAGTCGLAALGTPEVLADGVTTMPVGHPHKAVGFAATTPTAANSKPFLACLSFPTLHVISHRLGDCVLPSVRLPTMAAVVDALRPLTLQTSSAGQPLSTTEVRVRAHQIIDYLSHAMSVGETPPASHNLDYGPNVYLNISDGLQKIQAPSVLIESVRSPEASPTQPSVALMQLLHQLQKRCVEAEESLCEQTSSLNTLVEQFHQLSAILQHKEAGHVHLARDIAALEELLHSRPSPEAYAKLQKRLEELQGSWAQERTERRKAEAAAARHHTKELHLAASTHHLKNEIRYLNVELSLTTNPPTLSAFEQQRGQSNRTTAEPGTNHLQNSRNNAVPQPAESHGAPSEVHDAVSDQYSLDDVEQRRDQRHTRPGRSWKGSLGSCETGLNSSDEGCGPTL